MHSEVKHCKVNVHNLTDIIIPPAVKICILLGLKFNYNLKPSYKKIYDNLAEGIRKMSWRVFFKNRGENGNNDELTKVCIKIKKSIGSSKLKCPIESVLFGKTFTKDCIKILSRLPNKNDVTHDYLLSQLKAFLLNNDIIIKPSDKNAGLVFMQTCDYEAEVMRQLTDLNTYIPSAKAQFEIAIQAFNDKTKHFSKLFFNCYKMNLKCMLPKNPKPAEFYILPKIHKKYENFPLGRPICSNVCTVNRGIAILLDAILQPLTLHIPNLLIDTPHLLTLLQNVQLDPNRKYYLLAADIQSMYQELPIECCKTSCLTFFRNFKNVTKLPFDITEKQLEILLDLSLDYSYIQFKNEYFYQKRGIQMGNNASVSIANITAAVELEGLWRHEMFFKKRFIDDILAIIDATDLTINVEDWIAQTFQHTFLKFTVEMSDKQINFLDLTISLNETNEISTTLYSKPMSKHEYLHFFSNHPKHIINSLPFSCGLRIVRICSNEEDRINNLTNMLNKFKRRKYPQYLLNETKYKLLQLDRNMLIQPSSNFHRLHMQLHNQATITNNSSQSERENNDVFIVLPFFKIAGMKQVIKHKILEILHNCGSVRLKKLALDLNVNIAFTIPSQASHIIATIDNIKNKEQSSG